MLTQYKSIGIVGSRVYLRHIVDRFLLQLLPSGDAVPEGFTVVSGGAMGADTYGELFARRAGFNVKTYLPVWERDGKFIRSAGFDRNGDIIAASEAVLAFWDGRSKGTLNSIMQTLKAGKPLRIILPDGTMFMPHSTKFQTGNVFWSTGDMFNPDDIRVQTIVNPCNTYGIAGAGISRQLAVKYPTVEQDYNAQCYAKTLQVGVLGNTKLKRGLETLNFLHFPTKENPRLPSQLSYIQQGLKDLGNRHSELGITTSAVFPMLGCGLGGLDWNEQVKPIMTEVLARNLNFKSVIVDRFEQAKVEPKLEVKQNDTQPNDK